MYYRQFPSDCPDYILKDWSERIKSIENFDELLDVSVKLNKELEAFPVNVIGDLQLKFKKKAIQIKACLNDNLEYAEII